MGTLGSNTEGDRADPCEVTQKDFFSVKSGPFISTSLQGFFPAFLRLHYSGFFGRCFFSRESWRFGDLALFRGWIPQ